MFLGIPHKEFPMIKQLDSSGCWAACLAMICQHYGVYVDEHSELHLSGLRQGANGQAICERLRGIESTGARPFKPDPKAIPWPEAAAFLPMVFARKEPVIVGMATHAVVGLNGAFDTRGHLESLGIADPAPVPPWGDALTRQQLDQLAVEVIFIWSPRRTR